MVAGGFSGIANNNVIVQFPLGGLEVYDPRDGLFTWVPESETLEIFFDSPVLADDDTLLLFGVWADEDEEIVGAGYSLDTSSLAWSKVAGPPTPVGFPFTAPLGDGRVLVVGGWDLEQEKEWYEAPDNLDVAQIYNVADNTWESAAPMNRMTNELRLVPLDDGRVMAIGIEDVKSGPVLAFAEIYDPASDTWSVINSVDPHYLPTNAVKLLDGRLLVSGGLRLGWTSLRIFREKGELNRVALPDGRFYYGRRIAEVFPDAKVYDPSADTWTAVKGMQGARNFSSMTLLPDGRVLLAGGEDPTAEDYQLYSTSAVFDPESNSLSDGPSLAERRSNHTATLLPDGRLLLVGGIGVWVSPTEQEEVYPLDAVETIDTSLIPEMLPPSTPEEFNAAVPCELTPIPAPVGLLPPAATPQSAEAILDAAQEAMDGLDSYHFEMDLAAKDEDGVSGFWSCERLVMDFLVPDRFHQVYWSHKPTIEFEVRSTTIGETVYIFSPETSEWRSYSRRNPPSNPTDLMDDHVILNLVDSSIEGTESLGGVEHYRISGKLSSEFFSSVFFGSPSFLGTEEVQLLLVFWVGTEDSLVSKISVEGEIVGEPGPVRVSFSFEFSAFDEDIVIGVPAVSVAPTPVS